MAQQSAVLDARSWAHDHGAEKRCVPDEETPKSAKNVEPVQAPTIFETSAAPFDTPGQLITTTLNAPPDSAKDKNE